MLAEKKGIMGKKTLTAEEAAEILKTTRAGVYAMVQRRQIPYIRLGKRKILFFEEELIAFLEKRSVEPIKEISPTGKRYF